MTALTPKLEKLISELKRATIEGKILWEETADEGEFRAALKPGMVRIGRRPAYGDGGGSMTTFNITLLN